jgi:hypothetical protein
VKELQAMGMGKVVKGLMPEKFGFGFGLGQSRVN